MTWRRWMGARQLLAEETLGSSGRETRRQEDEKFSRNRKAYQSVK